MSQLDFEDLLSDEGINQSKPVSRHLSPRQLVSLNLTDSRRPYASALRFWKQHSLATPIVWMVLDELGNEPNGAKVTVETMSPKEYAERLLKKLRNLKS